VTRVVVKFGLALALVRAVVVMGARAVGEVLSPAELLAYTNSTWNNTLQGPDFSIFLLDAGRGLNVNFIGGAGEPTWSPDGRELAFVAAREGSADIYISDLTNPSPRRLTHNNSMAAVDALAWSPSGDWIAYSTQTMSDARFYLIKLETKNTLGYTGFQTSIDWLTWSPDGQYLIGYGGYPSRTSISGALFMVNVQDGFLSYMRVGHEPT
jgi:Tol biopolymer transport system component